LAPAAKGRSQRQIGAVRVTRSLQVFVFQRELLHLLLLLGHGYRGKDFGEPGLAKAFLQC